MTLVAGTPLAGQDPSAIRIGIEPQFSLAVPQGAVAERWGVGAGLGLQVSAHLDRRYSLYVGYSATRFDLDVVDDMYASDRGFSAGAVRSFPGLFSQLAPWLRAGAVMHRMRVVQHGTGETASADGSPGFEVGGGITGSSNLLKPTIGLEYRRYTATILRPEREPVSYIGLRFGVTYQF